MKNFFKMRIGIFCFIIIWIGIPVYGANKIIGDINQDGKINILDSSKVFGYLNGRIDLTKEELTAADVTGDGKIDTRDGLMLLYKVSGRYTGSSPVTLPDYGDLNGDGKITISDSGKLLKYLDGKMDLTAQELAVADVNGDWKITLADGQILFQVVSGRIKEPLPIQMGYVGDLNQDKIVNHLDVTLLQEYINNGSTTYQIAYDINHDGKIDTLDIEELNNIIGKFGKQLTFEKTVVKIQKEEEMVALIDGEKVDNQVLSWTTNNASVAEVVNGTIIPIGNGTCTILAKTEDGSNLSQICQVMVDLENCETITIGDLNEDGKVDVKDSVMLIHYLSGKNRNISIKQLLAADVTGDNNIDTRDGFMLFYKVSGKYTGNFPVTLPKYGDIDGNGEINVVDAMKVFQYIHKEKELMPQELAVADVNGDGKITLADAQLIFYLVSGRIKMSFPYKYPYVGDLNSDEAVNQSDVTILQNYLNKRNVEYLFEYDINHDGIVDQADVAELNQIIENFGKELTLNKTTLNMTTKSNEELIVSIDGNTVNHETLNWSSSDTKVAEVINGWIIPVGNGNCVITCKTADGSNISKTCNVTVDFKVTSITLNKTSLTFHNKTAQEIGATVGPEYAKNKSVTWTSSNTKVATVNADGVVTPVGNGTCEIIAKTTDGSNITMSCRVTVVFSATSILLDKSHLTFQTQKEEKLVATIYPEYASDQEVKWESSNEQVAIVKNGVVKPVGNGNCTIKAKTTDGSNLEKTCRVEVKIPNFTNLRVEPEEIKFTDRKAKKIKVTVESAISKEIGFSSSNSQIVIVSKEGVVTPIKSGECVITVKALDGTEAQKEIPVQVTLPYIVGNFDQNDRVDVTDAYLLLNKIVNNTEITKEVEEIVDMNVDGRIDVTDAYLLLELLAQIF